MAKKRKPKVKSRRRRSVSGVGSKMQATLFTVAGIAAAAFAAKQIEKLLVDKTTGEAIVEPKLLAGAQIAAGALILPKFIPGALGEGLGNGLVAVGTLSLLTNMGVISGVGSPDVDFSQLQIVSGTENTPSLIAGIE